MSLAVKGVKLPCRFHSIRAGSPHSLAEDPGEEREVFLAQSLGCLPLTSLHELMFRAVKKKKLWQTTRKFLCLPKSQKTHTSERMVVGIEPLPAWRLLSGQPRLTPNFLHGRGQPSSYFPDCFQAGAVLALNPKPQNPQNLNPKPPNPKPLNP